MEPVPETYTIVPASQVAAECKAALEAVVSKYRFLAVKRTEMFPFLYVHQIPKQNDSWVQFIDPDGDMAGGRVFGSPTSDFSNCIILAPEA